MAELMKFMQASNGAFKSDLMKTFVAKHKGDFPQAVPSTGVPNTNTKTGASIFTAGESTTTTTTSTKTGEDTTDNANILMQKSVTDNNQTLSNTNTTTTTTTAAPENIITNRNANTNVNTNNSNTNTNANNRNANANANKKAAASPETPDSNANVSEVNAVLEEVKREMCDTTKMLVTQVTQATVDAHMSTTINHLQAVADARARFMAMKEAGQLPDMSKLSLSAGSMWEKMMDQMMPEMAKAVKFCKMLPGFSELCLDDQMLLIKNGTFEVMMTRFSMLIDHEKETMLDPSHKMVCPKAVIMAMPMGKFLGGFFHVGAQFNPVGLTDAEIGLFTAMLVLSPCRPGLTDVKLISSLQSLYQQAFFTLVKEKHSDPESVFSKALGLVPMFRRISEEHNKALAMMKQQAPDAEKQFPPMHKEFFGEQEAAH